MPKQNSTPKRPSLGSRNAPGEGLFLLSANPLTTKLPDDQRLSDAFNINIWTPQTNDYKANQKLPEAFVLRIINELLDNKKLYKISIICLTLTKR